MGPALDQIQGQQHKNRDDAGANPGAGPGARPSGLSVAQEEAAVIAGEGVDENERYHAQQGELHFRAERARQRMHVPGQPDADRGQSQDGEDEGDEGSNAKQEALDLTTCGVVFRKADAELTSLDKRGRKEALNAQGQSVGGEGSDGIGHPCHTTVEHLLPYVAGGEDGGKGQHKKK